MNIFKTNNVKMYTKTLQNTYFKINFKGTFPTIPTGVCNEIFTTKETCPPPTLNCVYCFTGFIGRGLILHVCQYSFQNHVKSRKIYM